MGIDRVIIYVAGVAASGIYLRWGLVPVWIAFEFGRRAERIRRHAEEKAAGRGIALSAGL